MRHIATPLYALVSCLIAAASSSVACAQNASQSADAAARGAAAAVMRDYEQDASRDVRSFCQQKWPDDYVMQKQCIEAQSEARAKVQAVDVLGSKVKMQIWAKCSGDWTDKKSNLTDWVMMSHCYDSQWSAYRAVND